MTAICGVSDIHAQGDSGEGTNEQLRACDQITDTMAKLACFDEIIKGLDQTSTDSTVNTNAESTTVDDVAAASIPVVAAGSADDAVTASSSSSSQVVATSSADDVAATSAPVAAAGAAVAIAAQEPVEEMSVEDELFEDKLVEDKPVEDKSAMAESSTVATSSAESSVAAAAAVSAEDNFGFSEKQVESAMQDESKAQEVEAQKAKDASEQEQIDSIRATVVSAWSTIDGRFETLLDNGQVWRETSATRAMRMPKEGESVVISRGRLKSFRMKIGNNNRLLWQFG